MIDGYFLKSLLSMIAAYIMLVGGLVCFILITGFWGGFIVIIALVLPVIYFYGERGSSAFKGRNR